MEELKRKTLVPVIIPAFNEEKTIGLVIQNALKPSAAIYQP